MNNTPFPATTPDPASFPDERDTSSAPQGSVAEWYFMCGGDPDAGQFVGDQIVIENHFLGAGWEYHPSHGPSLDECEEYVAAAQNNPRLRPTGFGVVRTFATSLGKS